MMAVNAEQDECAKKAGRASGFDDLRGGEGGTGEENHDKISYVEYSLLHRLIRKRMKEGDDGSKEAKLEGVLGRAVASLSVIGSFESMYIGSRSAQMW